MGKYVNVGKNLTALDLINRHTWWVLLGRCDFKDGGTYPWPDEGLETEAIPAVDVTAVEPDADDMVESDYNRTGVVKATTVALVIEDPGGSIEVNGVKYSISSNPDSKNPPYIYWKFSIDPDFFIYDLDPSGLSNAISGYRRISLRADMIPNNINTNSVAIRRDGFIDPGTLFYYANHELRQRPVSNVQADLIERHVLRLVLQPSVLV